MKPVEIPECIVLGANEIMSEQIERIKSKKKSQ